MTIVTDTSIQGQAILIVEDAPDTMALLVGFMTEQGFAVASAGTCAEARTRLSAGPVALVLLDVNLPDGDGFALARSLRDSGTPVIFVTGRTDDDDRIRGLEAGEDYVTKPVNLRELLARVRNVLRRANPKAPSLLAIDGWTIDLIRREVFRPDGTLLPLTTGEFNILAALAAARPAPVERTILLDVISNRDPSAICEHTVDTLVARLRRKMRLGTDEDPPIVTVRGVGYAMGGRAG